MSERSRSARAVQSGAGPNTVHIKNQATGWAKRAEALADWALARLFVRRDVYGAYKPDGTQWTAHDALTRDLLIDHFRGRMTIGAHSSSPDDRCLSAALDIDAHDGDDKADPDRNWRCALASAEEFAKFELNTVLCDSNGKGGYHVRVFFKKPVSVVVAYWLCQTVVANLVSAGYPEVESFPKQGELTIDRPYGNWLRIPGKHHKRDHWTQLYDLKAQRWLPGAAAAERLINVAGDDTKALLDAYGEWKAQQPAEETRKPEKRDSGRRDSADELAKARDALSYIPNQDVDYDYWLGVGMALCELRGDGLSLWDEWSKQSRKYDQATTAAKYASFSPGAGVTLGTLFHRAKENGWSGSRGANGQDGGHASSNGNGRHTRNDQGDGEEDHHKVDYETMTAAELGIVNAEDVEPENPEWLWERRFFIGKINTIAGEGGEGKTTIAIAVGAVVTTGGTFADGSPAGDPGLVMMLGAEDGLGDTLLPRFIAVGADISRLKFLTARVTIKAKGKTPAHVHPVSLQDNDYWRHIFKTFRPRVLIIDPLPAYMGRGVNDHKNSEVQVILTHFAEVAREFGVCVIAITHVGKSMDRKLIHKVIGSVAYTNTSRVVHVALRDPDDPKTRYLERVKTNNDAPVDALVYHLVSAEFEYKGNTYRTSKAEFEADSTAIDAEAMANPKQDGKPRRERDSRRETQLAEWLVDFLDGRSWTRRKDVYDAAGEAGLIGQKNKVTELWSNGTLIQRARKRVPSLAEPRNGCEIVAEDLATERDRFPEIRWRLARIDVPF